MTIGIGVLATTPEGRKNGIVPNVLVLMADTMGSFGDVSSHERLHKVITMPSEKLYATIAGDVSRGAQLVPCICSFIKDIPEKERTFGSIQRAIAEGCYQYRHQLFTLWELPRLRLPPHAFNPNQQLEPELNNKIQVAWENFDLGCDLVIGVFDKDERAYLFSVSASEHEVRNMSFPGFAAIGVGSENAMFWLSHRKHTLGYPLLTASYHAYEAKVMAESSAHVNKHFDILVATADDHWVCTTHANLSAEKEHPEVNIKVLKKLYRKFGPRETVKVTAQK